MSVNKIFKRISGLAFFLFLIGGSFTLIPNFIDNVHAELNENNVTKNNRIWIWSLSELSDDYAKNYCLNYAIFYASEIAQSDVGQQAFKKVTKPDQSLSIETTDKIGKHPQIQVKNLVDKWAQYEGDGGIDENTIYLDRERLNSLLELCEKPDKEKDVLLFITAIILHETAHWSDHVLKHSEITKEDNFEYKGYTGGDTPGEEGFQLEKDLFGGIISIGPTKGEKLTSTSSLLKDEQLVDEYQKKTWFNLSYWDNN